MKAILNFDLDDPDDRMSHMRCIKSFDMAYALFEVRYNMLRQVEDSIDNKSYETLQEFINKIMENINIDELID